MRAGEGATLEKLVAQSPVSGPLLVSLFYQVGLTGTGSTFSQLPPSNASPLLREHVFLLSSLLAPNAPPAIS